MLKQEKPEGEGEGSTGQFLKREGEQGEDYGRNWRVERKGEGNDVIILHSQEKK